MLGQLDSAAILLFGWERVSCGGQAQRLAGLLTNTLGLVEQREDPKALLIDHALRSRRAHPILIAGIGCELARRAGARSYLAESDEGWWTVLAPTGSATAVATGAAQGPPGRSPMRGVCPHELAGRVLALLDQHPRQPWSATVSEL